MLSNLDDVHIMNRISLHSEIYGYISYYVSCLFFSEMLTKNRYSSVKDYEIIKMQSVYAIKYEDYINVYI